MKLHSKQNIPQYYGITILISLALSICVLFISLMQLVNGVLNLEG